MEYVLWRFGPWIGLTLLVGAAIVALAWRSLSAFITRRVTSTAQEVVDRRVREHQGALAKELESHRMQLAVVTETARSSLQRQTQEFGLYAAKRYEVYPELFKLMLHAEGALAAFYGLRSEPGFQHESRDEIQSLLLAREVPGELRTEILELFDVGNRQKFADRLRDILRDIERGEAVGKYWLAKNYFLEHELFLSEAALPVVDKAFDAMHDMVGYVRFPEPRPGRDGLGTKKQMSAAIDEARQAMRRDLQRTDFGSADATTPSGNIAPPA